MMFEALVIISQLGVPLALLLLPLILVIFARIVRRKNSYAANKYLFYGSLFVLALVGISFGLSFSFLSYYCGICEYPAIQWLLYTYAIVITISIMTSALKQAAALMQQ